MKDLMYVGLMFTGFSGCILLSFVGNAYPVFYQGVHVVFASLVAILMIGNLIFALYMAGKKNGYLRRADLWIGGLPSLIGCGLLAISYAVGLWVSQGG
jgi:heme A synthase